MRFRDGVAVETLRWDTTAKTEGEEKTDFSNTKSTGWDRNNVHVCVYLRIKHQRDPQISEYIYVTCM